MLPPRLTVPGTARAALAPVKTTAPVERETLAVALVGFITPVTCRAPPMPTPPEKTALPVVGEVDTVPFDELITPAVLRGPGILTSPADAIENLKAAPVRSTMSNTPRFELRIS